MVFTILYLQIKSINLCSTMKWKGNREELGHTGVVFSQESL